MKTRTFKTVITSLIFACWIIVIGKQCSSFVIGKQVQRISKNYYSPNLYNFILGKNLRVLIVSSYVACGERQTTMRIANAIDKLGYSSCVIYGKHPILAKVIKSDFSITFNHNKPPYNCNYNFYVFHQPDYLKCNIRDYDAFLTTIPKIYLPETIVKNKDVIPFYLSEAESKFDASDKSRLFFCGDLWDHYRLSLLGLYRMLDKTGYFDVYGTEKCWLRYGLESYKGFIPAFKDGAIIDVMKKCGVSLVLHSNEHFKHNVATSRIFESAAASNVIICDRIPFVVENFADSVLYVDRNASQEEMFKQIDNHMKWILANPDEAKKLARRSHEIFVKNFSLEKQVQRVIDFYFQKVRKTEGSAKNCE